MPVVWARLPGTQCVPPEALQGPIVISDELQACIAQRHACTGQVALMYTHHFGVSANTGTPFDYANTRTTSVEPLTSVDVPEWLVAGGEIQSLLVFPGETPTILRVIEVSPEMTLVEPRRHAITTATLVAYWGPVPHPTP